MARDATCASRPGVRDGRRRIVGCHRHPGDTDGNAAPPRRRPRPRRGIPRRGIRLRGVVDGAGADESPGGRQGLPARVGVPRRQCVAGRIEPHRGGARARRRNRRAARARRPRAGRARDRATGPLRLVGGARAGGTGRGTRSGEVLDAEWVTLEEVRRRWQDGVFATPWNARFDQLWDVLEERVAEMGRIAG